MPPPNGGGGKENHMEERNYGEMTTLECRALAHEMVNKKKRCNEILFILDSFNEPMTAWEIAHNLLDLGFTNRLDRNNAAPRLTEMCKEGIVEPVGKKLCVYTGRKVTAYQIRRDV